MRSEILRIDQDELPVEIFRRKYLKQGNPVIIENCLKHLPLSKWTMEYLVKKVGQNKVTVRGKTDANDYKVGLAYSIRDTTVEKYVDDLVNNKPISQSSYLAVQNISYCFPQIKDECELPKYVEKHHQGPFLWVGRKGHYEYCHFDPDASMLMMIEGSKEVKLYSCENLQNLYPNKLGSNGKTIQSQVHCDNPDFEKCPLFKNVHCHTGVLNPGDMLFIPAFWWHQVTSLTNSTSVNVFFGDPGTSDYIQRITKAPVVNSFHYWLLNIVEQNREYESFKRSLERLDQCIQYFILKQFHEELSEELTIELRKVIMNYLKLDELPEYNGNGGKHPPPIKIRGLRYRSAK